MKSKNSEKSHQSSGDSPYSAFDKLLEGCQVIDKDWRYFYVNDAVAKQARLPKEKLLGSTMMDVFPGIENGPFFSVLRKCMIDSIPQQMENEFTFPDGSKGWFELRFLPVPEGIMIFSLDITERKKIELDLNEREGLLNEVGKIAKIGGWEMDLLTRKARWTQGTYDIVEIEKGEPIPGPDEHIDYYLPEYRPLVTESMRALIEEDRPLEFDAQLRTAKGNVKWCRALGRCVRQDGKCVKVYGIFQDITEHKQAENALESQKRLSQQYLEVAGIMFIAFNKKQEVTLINPKGCEILGYREEEILGKNWFENFLASDNIQEVKQVFDQIISGDIKPVEYFENPILRKDGTTRLIAWHNSILRDDSGNIMGVLCSGEDITQRNRAEEALKESEEKYRHLFESGLDAYFFLEKDTGNILEVNKSAIDLFGYSQKELLSMNLIDLSAEPEKTRKAMKEGVTMVPLRLYRKKDGSILPVEISGRDFRWRDKEVRITSIRDISRRKKAEEEKKKLEEQLRQAQKLEAIGRLAGGVAHDFNNLLSVIIGYGEIILDNLKIDHPHYEPLDEILKAALRARDLTKQLLAFSRKQVLEMQTVNINEMVIGFEKMLRRMIGEDIDLELSLTSDTVSVVADKAQLEHVLMNLAVNARDAMPDGGVLTIQTSIIELDKDLSEKKPGVTPGKYAMISVSDTGGGIDHDIQECIFEPFFTTKEKGKGTGLGLSTSYGIIKQHKGNIWVYSEPGYGTTFKIYLPLSAEKAEPKTHVPSRKRIESVTGSTTILIVEDDQSVRKLTVRILKKAGYIVIESEDIEDAIAQAEKHDPPIHLVLTDIVMPKMKGPEVYEKIREHHPQARVLYMTGYSDKLVIHNGFLREGDQYIQKPFTAQALNAKVKEVLDQ